MSDVPNVLKVVPNVTLADVRHNAGVLGCSYIHYAESLGFTHEYAQELKEATTQAERRLLLKKLLELKLTDTKVCRATVQKLAQHCEQPREFATLHFSVAFSKELMAIVSEEAKKFTAPESKHFTS